MAFRVMMSADGLGHVVTLQGLLDDNLLDATSAELLAVREHRGSIVIDLRDVTLVSPAILAQLIDRLERYAANGNVSIVCNRLSGRRLVRRACQNTAIRVLSNAPQPNVYQREVGAEQRRPAIRRYR